MTVIRDDIFIRPYSEEDADALHQAARESHGDVYPWLPWCHAAYQIREARAWIADQQALREARTEFEFAIVSTNGRYLGGCGLNQLIHAHRVANLGYWVRSSEAGRGVAPAAVHTISRWAFAHSDLQRLEIVAAVDNHRSQRVAEKAGAFREGVLASRLFLHGRHHDAVLYSITRDRALTGDATRPLNRRALRPPEADGQR